MAATVGAAIAALFLAAHDAGLSLRIDGPIPQEQCAAVESPEAAVTVRVWDRRGNTTHGGSGAIIGRSDRAAMVLTCYHTHRGGGRDIVIRGHGYEERGQMVAADPSRDLALIVTPADPRMPVARVHVREMARGDRVTLSGFGGGRRGLLVRRGPAESNRDVRARTDYGDSGGPAFINGRICGVVVTNTAPGTAYGTTGVVPLRDVYRLANTIRHSSYGSSIYQRAGDEVLCGLVPAVGRILFGNRAKRMGKGPWGPNGRLGQCGPDGCPPNYGGSVPQQPNDGQPWYAPGFGPNDNPNANKPAPIPGDPVVVDPPPGSTIDIDLSGFVRKPEFDELAARFDGLATKADIEIVIERVGAIEGAVTQAAGAITTIDQRLTAVETRPVEPVDKPTEPVPTKRHWVVVADWASETWPALLRQVEGARSAGAVIDTVDSRRINGIVAAPQIIGYVNGKPSSPISGDRAVALELQRITKGG